MNVNGEKETQFIKVITQAKNMLFALLQWEPYPIN